MSSFKFTAMFFDGTPSTALFSRIGTLEIQFPNDPAILRYSDGSPDSIHEFASGFVPLDIREIFENGFTVFGDPSMLADVPVTVTEIVTEAGSHIMMQITLTGSRTVLFQIGGDPFDFPFDASTYDEFRGTVVSETIVTSGPFGPDTDIIVADIPGAELRIDDVLQGTSASELLDGGIGDDTIIGGGGNDTLLGGDGGDRIQGGDGNDSIESGGNTGGSTRTDNIIGSAGNDTLNVDGDLGDFVALIYGQLDGPIVASVNGVTGMGTVDKGLNGTDTVLNVDAPLSTGTTSVGLGILATDQDDSINVVLEDGQVMFIYGSGGSDEITITGSGLVRLAYLTPSSAGGIVADLSVGRITRGADVDTITGTVWEIDATDADDQVTGSNADESFRLRGGNDTVDGGGGFDQLRLEGGLYDDAVSVNLGAGTATGGYDEGVFSYDVSNIEAVIAWRFDDTLIGADVANLLIGQDGDDTLVGLLGDDTLQGGNGSDVMDGGGGIDTASYVDAETRVKIDLLNGLANTGDAGGDTFTDIEAYVLGDFDDAFFGSLDAEDVYGGMGADSVKARAGRDKIFGEDGNDTLDGGKARDRIEGGNGNDLIEGRKGKDNLRGGKGDDDVRGGEDNDILIGGKGQDTLDGGLDNDRLDGGLGDDSLTGGSGSDLFIFGTSHGDDVIKDFDATDADERIDLSALTAIADFADLMTAHATDTADGVLIDTAEGTILVAGLSKAELDSADFLFAL